MLNRFILFVFFINYLISGSSLKDRTLLGYQKANTELIETSYAEPINYLNDGIEYASIKNFEMSNVQNAKTKVISIAYEAHERNHYYTAEIGYTYTDGDYVTDCSDYFYNINKYATTRRSISFEANFDNFSYPYYEMYVSVVCFDKRDVNGTSFTDYLYELTIFFTLAHHGGYVTGRRNKVKVPYRFVYTEDNYQCDIYYDYIDFLWFETTKADQLYFRIKPSELTFTSGGYEMNNDVKLRILNTNEFDSTINNPNSNNSNYQLMISKTTNNITNLKFKNQIFGGSTDLYLNPFNREMSKEKTEEYPYKVNNIYLPKYSSLKESGLDIEIELTFGRIPLIITWPMKITFSNEVIEDYYFTKMIGNQVTDEDMLEEIIIP